MKMHALAAYFLIAAGCKAFYADDGIQPDILNHELKSALLNPSDTDFSEKPPLLFDSGKNISNCSEYIDERTSSAPDEAFFNRIASKEYVICDAADFLSDATFFHSPRADAAFYTGRLISDLNLGSFLSSLGPQIQGMDDPVINNLQHFTVRSERYSVILDADDWRLTFELVARADFSGDGLEDWLVFFTDEAKIAEYRGYGLLVLDNALKPGLLDASRQR